MSVIVSKFTDIYLSGYITAEAKCISTDTWQDLFLLDIAKKVDIWTKDIHKRIFNNVMNELIYYPSVGIEYQKGLESFKSVVEKQNNFDIDALNN